MITYKDKVFNSWEEIVEFYPMMWVIFDRAVMVHGRVVEGHIMAILPDEEVIEYRHIHDKEIRLALRTTEGVFPCRGLAKSLHAEFFGKPKTLTLIDRMPKLKRAGKTYRRED